jgi:hypothetical protein
MSGKLALGGNLTNAFEIGEELVCVAAYGFDIYGCVCRGVSMVSFSQGEHCSPLPRRSTAMKLAMVPGEAKTSGRTAQCLDSARRTAGLRVKKTGVHGAHFLSFSR